MDLIISVYHPAVLRQQVTERSSKRLVNQRWGAHKKYTYHGMLRDILHDRRARDNAHTWSKHSAATGTQSWT